MDGGGTEIRTETPRCTQEDEKGSGELEITNRNVQELKTTLRRVVQQFFYPLIVDINKKILNYLSYLRGKDDNSMVKQSLEISIELFNNGQNSFYSNLMKMSEYFNLFDFNYNSLSDSKIKQLLDVMKKKHVSYWNHTLQHSRKLSFHHSIKKNYSPSAYLNSTRKNPIGRTS